MIDELDRIMTTNGTIGVKSPDVWGQDRLAKFRSEYETQMSEWLKTAFKGEVNAAVRRGETEVRRLHVGATLAEPLAEQGTGRTRRHADDRIGGYAGAIARGRRRRRPCGRSPPGEDVRPARANRRSRRALELPEPPQPVAADQRGRRPDRSARLRALPRPDPGHALSRAQEPARARGRSSRSRRSRS